MEENRFQRDEYFLVEHEYIDMLYRMELKTE